jgi:hypothetical protein
MLADWDQHFASHVSALLCPRSLVLNMDTSCSLLDEQFRKLHHCGETAVAGICVCDDGAEVVDVCELGACGFGFCGYAFFALFAVVEKLSHEEMGDFVWDGGLEMLVFAILERGVSTYVGVICQIWTGLVGGRGCG